MNLLNIVNMFVMDYIQANAYQMNIQLYLIHIVLFLFTENSTSKNKTLENKKASASIGR